jgi:hypothetical protein
MLCYFQPMKGNGSCCIKTDGRALLSVRNSKCGEKEIVIKHIIPTDDDCRLLPRLIAM